MLPFNQFQFKTFMFCATTVSGFIMPVEKGAIPNYGMSGVGIRDGPSGTAGDGDGRDKACLVSTVSQ